ncbi:MAG: hypothetical protein ACM3OB_10980, partial [Acidobacteriota bacterium]
DLPMSLPYLLEPLIAGLVLALCAWTAGARWVADRGLAATPIGEWALATALGLGLLGGGGYALATLGLLRGLPVALLAAALALPGVAPAGRVLRRLRLAGGANRVELAVVAAFGAIALALALYPPLPFDETLYHLPTARAYAASGGLPFLVDLRLPVSPALCEVLAAEVLLFARATSVHLVSWLATAATAALLVEWGGRRGSRAAGLWAAAIYVGSPLVLYLQGTAYVEPLLAMFATAGLLAWDVAERDGTGWRAAAIFSGFAAATKYLGLFLVAILLVRKGWRAWRERRWRGAFATSALAALPMLLPYGRIFLATGNPLFPFASSIFGSTAWSYNPGGGAGRVATLVEWLRAPFDAVFRPARVGQQPPVSPAYLLVLALLLASWRRGGERFGRWALGLTAAYAAVLPLVHIRYLLPAAPALALAGALSLTRWRALDAPRWSAALAVACLLPGLAWGTHRFAKLGPPPASAAAREAFLTRQVPGYEGLAWLRSHGGEGATVYGAWCEQLRDYAGGRFLGEVTGPAAYWRVLDPAQPEVVYRRLRRLGVDHVLVPQTPRAAARFAERLRASPLFREVYRGPSAAVYAVLGVPGAAEPGP